MQTSTTRDVSRTHARAHALAVALACVLAHVPAHAQDTHDAHQAHGDHTAHGMQPQPRHSDAHAQDTHDGHGTHAMHGDSDGNGDAIRADGDLPADAAPHTPVPPITDADRAAARGPVHTGHGSDGSDGSDDTHGAHGAHDHDRRVHRFLLVDRLETWDAAPGSGEAWEVAGWIGRDIDKLRLRSEGERKHGHTESADVELLYSRAIAPWWDLTAGVRHDFAPGESQDWAALGVIGMAPYKFEVEATAYLGASGRTALRAEAEYSLLLSDRLILQPLVEAEWHGRSDAARGVGDGLGKVETGLRLRYEIRREFAPYVGIVHERTFGRTADFIREEGEHTRDTRVVFGVRMWF